MKDKAYGGPVAHHPEKLLLPFWAQVMAVRQETADVSTLDLRFLDTEIAERYRFQPGQFNMLYLPGYGEAAISISSDPAAHGCISHTVRFVGNVTHAISRLSEGQTLGLRGPFGRPWPVEEHQGADVIIAAGGIGLAPLRPVIYHLMRQRQRFGRVVLLYGARSPSDLLFREHYPDWEEKGVEVMITVDRADDSWQGQVGVVPMLFYRLRVDPASCVVYSCGPEIMMRFVVFEGLARRVPPERIYLSLERNMKCGQGMCGRCQYGPFFVCKDGPVFTYRALEPYFNVEEL
jgi:NAD(P)H-flavin reductase